MKILARSEKNREFFYIPSSARAVSAKNAAVIRDALCDEIRRNKCPSFEAFAEDIEGQIRGMLLRHPEYIPDALAPTEPDKWYPCDHPYQIDDYTREA